MRFKITRTRQIEIITTEPGNAIGRLSGWHDEVSTFVVDGRDALRRELDAEAVPAAQQRQDVGRFGDSRYSVAWEPIDGLHSEDCVDRAAAAAHDSEMIAPDATYAAACAAGLALLDADLTDCTCRVDDEQAATPAQLAVLAVVDEHGASMLAARTWPAKNHVHVSAARALVRRGVLVEQLGPDGVFVSRAKSVSA
jgi:hypothetical protein